MFCFFSVLDIYGISDLTDVLGLSVLLRPFAECSNCIQQKVREEQNCVIYKPFGEICINRNKHAPKYKINTALGKHKSIDVSENLLTTIHGTTKEIRPQTK